MARFEPSHYGFGPSRSASTRGVVVKHDMPRHDQTTPIRSNALLILLVLLPPFQELLKERRIGQSSCIDIGTPRRRFDRAGRPGCDLIFRRRGGGHFVGHRVAIPPRHARRQVDLFPFRMKRRLLQLVEALE